MIETGWTDKAYFDHVSRAWAALPRLDPGDACLREEIRDSWVRCAAAGLSCGQAEDNVRRLYGHLRSEPGREIPSAEGCYTARFTVGEREVVLSIIGQSAGERLGLLEDERRVGTTAIALAWRLKRGISVNGPEHYARCLHGHYSYAEPVFDSRQQVCGVCCVDSVDCRTTEQLRPLVHTLACVGGAIWWMKQEDRDRDIAINGLLEQIPQGVVYIDRKNVIRYFNRRALEAFGLKNTGEDSIIFTRCIALVCNAHGQGWQSASVNYRDNKKVEVMVLPLSEHTHERLILLDDRRAKPREKDEGRQALWNFEDVLTASPEMLRLKRAAAQAAAYHVPVMLVGASGTGKEMLAHAIHNASPWRDGPFVALNASAIAPNLVESELFGYERGSFTDASQEGKVGYFEAASGGTLFLDELDSIPYEVQTKLLRAVSSRSIRRIGGTADIPVDVRLVSAARMDVLELARQGRFREDLYYRLSPVKLRIPDLADRTDDIPLLAGRFIAEEAQTMGVPCPQMSEDFVRCLQGCSWPGNVRELRNALRHALVFLEQGRTVLEPAVLPEYVQLEAKERGRRDRSAGRPDRSLLKQAALAAVSETLRLNGGNTEAAAKSLGVSLATVYNYAAKARRSLEWEEDGA
mgnify:FL=1